MKNRTRIVAFVLTVMMLFSLSSVCVYADGDMEEATEILEAVETGNDTDVETEGAQEISQDDSADNLNPADVLESAADESATEEDTLSLEVIVQTEEDSDSMETEATKEGKAGAEENATTGGNEAPDEELSIEVESEAEVLLNGDTEDSYDPIYEEQYGPCQDSCDVLIEGDLYYSLAFEALELVNEVRAEAGEDPLVMDEAALEHAMMRAVQVALYCNHGQPNGATHGYGCTTSISGENIAAGHLTAESAVNGWVNSIGHYSTMVNSSFVSTGIGVFKVGGYYFWVQSFSREDGTTVYASSYSDRAISATVNIADYRIEEKIDPYLSDSFLKVGETAHFDVWFTEQNEKLYPCKYELPAEGMIYTSSDESIVTVDEYGVLTAVGEGTATITATYPDYDLEPWTFDVTVCNHDSGYTSTVTTEPTCDTDGVRTYTCEECGDSYTEAIAELGHTWDDGVVTEEPTCVDYGSRVLTCTTCGDTRADLVIPTYQHNYDDGVVTTEATCGASGTKTYTCGTCGATTTEEISPTYDHTYDDGVVGLPATCSTSGTLIHTCTGCGTTKTTYVAATNEHTLGNEPTLIKEPTCTSYGSKGYFCEVCDQMIGSVILIDPIDHVYDEGVPQSEVSCGAIVKMLYTCESCGNEKTTSVQIAHEYDSGVVTTEPTCTTKGKTTYTCELCGKTKRIADIAALGHNEVEDAYVAPSCEGTGLEAGSHCDRCNEVIVEQVVIPATGHSYSSTVVAPTCTTGGYTEHICSACEDTYQDTPTSSLGHSWDAGIVTTSPKCESTGVMTHTCSVCGSTKTEAIAATGHSYEKTITDPTCTEQGYTTYTCSACDDSYTTDYVDKLGHSMDGGTILQPVTCTEDGIMLYSCKHCDETSTEEICAIGHCWDEGVITTEPTCTEAGEKTYTCEHDTSHTKVEEVEALGHNEVEDSYVAPACEKEGLEAGSHCDRCDTIFTEQETIPALSHDWDAGTVTTEAGCEEEGLMTYTCSRCEETKTEPIAATGHDYEDMATAPGCEAEGYTTHTCVSCGDSYKDTFTSPTGHTWDEGVVTKIATIVQEGEITYTCSVCDETKTETIPMRTEGIRGDVNMDGTVNVLDVIRLLRCVAGFTVEADLGVADMNTDGEVNVKDVLRLLRYVCGWDV